MTRMRSSLFTFLLVVPSAFAGGKDPSSLAPAYDAKTEIQFEGQVAGTREVSTGPLQGVYLTVTAKGESTDLYLAPVAFIKMIDAHFNAGETVEVTGSKVVFNGKDLVLTRELRLGKTTLALRDKNGSPNWLWTTKGFPSGL